MFSSDELSSIFILILPFTNIKTLLLCQRLCKRIQNQIANPHFIGRWGICHNFKLPEFDEKKYSLSIFLQLNWHLIISPIDEYLGILGEFNEALQGTKTKETLFGIRDEMPVLWNELFLLQKKTIEITCELSKHVKSKKLKRYTNKAFDFYERMGKSKRLQKVVYDIDDNDGVNRVNRCKICDSDRNIHAECDYCSCYICNSCTAYYISETDSYICTHCFDYRCVRCTNQLPKLLSYCTNKGTKHTALCMWCRIDEPYDEKYDNESDSNAD